MKECSNINCIEGVITRDGSTGRLCKKCILTNKQKLQVLASKEDNESVNNIHEFFDQIKESTELLKRKSNWDDEGALELNRKSYTYALELIFRLINSIGTDIHVPYIDMCPDGNIDLHWDVKEKATLLIFVKERQLSWYGVTHDKKIETKGKTEDFDDTELYDFIAKYLRLNKVEIVTEFNDATKDPLLYIAFSILGGLRSYNMTKENYCRLVGITQEQLYLILKGQIDITIGLLSKLEEPFGIDLLQNFGKNDK